jgi:hypothetical protein
MLRSRCGRGGRVVSVGGQGGRRQGVCLVDFGQAARGTAEGKPSRLQGRRTSGGSRAREEKSLALEMMQALVDIVLTKIGLD